MTMSSLPIEVLIEITKNLHPHCTMKLQFTNLLFSSFVTFDYCQAVSHMKTFASSSASDDDVDIVRLNKNYAIAFVVCFGFTKSVQRLVGTKVILQACLLKPAMLHRDFDASIDEFRVIKWAASAGAVWAIDLLAKSDARAYFSIDDNMALRNAARFGHVGVVRILLKFSNIVDTEACDNYAIRLAAQNGHTEIVRELLQSGRVNASAKQNAALKLALLRGHKEIVELLVVSGQVDPTVQILT
ncbi:hypothetical protein HK100_002468 [Physocladia obscura]|uniref:Ankyrin repeat protein n=1 Tax=Physocladia obscura TaxID=109957 RepID=A0AAD5XB22_9FUNG|nr:hypothetical protein HK100_002468 [Physocladia obscura]